MKLDEERRGKSSNTLSARKKKTTNEKAFFKEKGAVQRRSCQLSVSDIKSITTGNPSEDKYARDQLSDLLASIGKKSARVALPGKLNVSLKGTLKVALKGRLNVNLVGNLEVKLDKLRIEPTK